MYRGYGSVCDVPCSFPPTCTFTAQVTWTGGYCCGAAPESFVDCVCDRGNARCRIPYTPAIGDRTFPTTFCELCWDAGGPIDVGADDGG